MVRKMFCAVVVMTVAIGFVVADEFNATITKVDGNKITYQKYKKSEVKGKKGEKDGDPVTLEVAKDAKIAKGTQAKGKVEVGDPIEGGLKADVFAKVSEEKGVGAHITTDDTKKVVTRIVIIGKKKAAN